MLKKLLFPFLLFTVTPVFGQNDSSYPTLMLERIYSSAQLDLPATDGWDTFLVTSDTILSYVHPYFREIDQLCDATPPARFQVYQTQKGFDGTLRELFSSLDTNLSHLVLTPPQIKAIYRRYPGLFIEQFASFALIESRGEHYFVGIELTPGGFWVYPFTLENLRTFSGLLNYRFIVPAPQ